MKSHRKTRPDPIRRRTRAAAVRMAVLGAGNMGTALAQVLAMLRRLAPAHSCVHLAGPAIAGEFVRGWPTSIVLASEDEPAAARVAGWLAGPALLPSTTTDWAGAALGGILKNVYAIILGCLDTLAANARNLEAAVVAAAVAEMAAIACARGGQAATVHGLAGLGDLVVTGFSTDSRNRRLGQMLASGRSAAAIKRELKWLPEGAGAARAACALARAERVPAPLAGWVLALLRGAPPTLESLVRILRDPNKYA